MPRSLAGVGGLLEFGQAELRGRVQSLLANTSRFIDGDALAERYATLRRVHELNLERLGTKRLNPSEATQLESSAEAAKAMADLMENANQAIQSHNELNTMPKNSEFNPLKIRKSNGSVEVLDESDIPNEYWVIVEVKKLDKKRILND